MFARGNRSDQMFKIKISKAILFGEQTIIVAFEKKKGYYYRISLESLHTLTLFKNCTLAEDVN